MTRIILKDEVSKKTVKYRKIVDPLINDGKGMPVSKQVRGFAVGTSFFLSNEWVGFEFRFDEKDKLKGVHVRFGFKGRYDNPIKLGSLTLSKWLYAPSSLTCNGELFLVEKGNEVLLTVECRRDKPRGLTAIGLYLDYKRGDFRLNSEKLRLPVVQGTEVDYKGEAKFLDRIENMRKDVSVILWSMALIPRNNSRLNAGLLPIPVVRIEDTGEVKSGLLFGVTPYMAKVGFSVKSLPMDSIKLIANNSYFSEKRALFDMSEESLSDLYSWILNYNVSVSNFHRDHVLLQFPERPGCRCKEVVVPTRTLFSKFKFVDVMSNNLSEIVNPFMYGKSKVASGTYYKWCVCVEKHRHFYSSPDYKIFKGNAVEAFCKKLEEVHDDLVKQI
jgi:hypothetical protein